MQRFQLSLSLTSKIVLVSLAVSLSVTMVISGLLYRSTQENLRNEDIRAISRDLEGSMAELDQDLIQLEGLVTWASVDVSITRFLEVDHQPLYTSEPTAVSARNSLDSQLFSTPISEFVCKLLISADDERSISTGHYEGILFERDLIRSRPYFDELFGAEGFRWIGLVDDTFYQSSRLVTRKTFPIVRPVRKLTTGQVTGWIYIAVSPELLTARIADRVELGGTTFLWRMGPRYYRITGEGFEDVTAAVEAPGIPDSIRHAQIGEIVVEGKRTEVVGVSSAQTDWAIMQYVPPASSHGGAHPWILGYALIVFLLFSVLMYISISRIISRPIKRIVRRIQHVSTGDFSIDPSIEGADEIGSIGKSINQMSASISALMEQQRRVEAAKRDLELSNLQKQINPHFIYNTLNTIKWMAIIQQADGIVHVIDTMVTLLRSIAKDMRLRIPLRDEFAFLEAYINLLRYRYGNTFSYSVELEDCALEDAAILKFTLQPIVENAIFHGLEPQERSGWLRLRVRREGEDLVISVHDNGVGMESGQIAKILGSQTGTGDIITNLGISNVDQRIKLEFGARYGVCIDSIPGQYTNVTIRYPYLPYQANRL